VVFDWGGTLMRELGLPGPMVEWPTVEMVPGAGEALALLEDRTLCYVASGAASSNGALALAALERVGLAHWFSGAFTAKELGAPKTDPAFYRALLQRIGLPAEACVMVGDSYEADVTTARAVGMQAVWFAEGDRGGNAPLTSATIHHLNELAPALERLGLQTSAGR